MNSEEVSLCEENGLEVISIVCDKKLYICSYSLFIFSVSLLRISKKSRDCFGELK